MKSAKEALEKALTQLNANSAHFSKEVDSLRIAKAAVDTELVKLKEEKLLVERSLTAEVTRLTNECSVLQSSKKSLETELAEIKSTSALPGAGTSQAVADWARLQSEPNTSRSATSFASSELNKASTSKASTGTSPSLASTLVAEGTGFTLSHPAVRLEDDLAKRSLLTVSSLQATIEQLRVDITRAASATADSFRTIDYLDDAIATLPESLKEVRENLFQASTELDSLYKAFDQSQSSQQSSNIPAIAVAQPGATVDVMTSTQDEHVLQLTSEEAIAMCNFIQKVSFVLLMYMNRDLRLALE